MLFPSSRPCIAAILFALCCGPLHAEPFRDCEVCPEMVIVPAGEFIMGAAADEEGYYENESPQHRVRINRFAAGRFEVTFEEWDACLADGGCGGYRPGDQGWGRGRRPVINVSWEDTQTYIDWLSRKSGKSYRLLSESEWEYAARAGTTTPFAFGETLSADQANYNGQYTYGSGTKGVNRKQTVPVGRFPANVFGLHDMHGNVWEWVEDCWHVEDNYEDAPADGSARRLGGCVIDAIIHSTCRSEKPRILRDCVIRAIRGGSWVNGPSVLRSATRSGARPDERSEITGFRVARSL